VVRQQVPVISSTKTLFKKFKEIAGYFEQILSLGAESPVAWKFALKRLDD
jgi:hypothetical protein